MQTTRHSPGLSYLETLWGECGNPSFPLKTFITVLLIFAYMCMAREGDGVADAPWQAYAGQKTTCGPDGRSLYLLGHLADLGNPKNKLPDVEDKLC